MPGPRSWEDRYFDGDDLGAADEQLFPIDGDDAEEYTDEDGWHDEATCPECIAYLEETDDDCIC